MRVASPLVHWSGRRHVPSSVTGNRSIQPATECPAAVCLETGGRRVSFFKGREPLFETGRERPGSGPRPFPRLRGCPISSRSQGMARRSPSRVCRPAASRRRPCPRPRPATSLRLAVPLPARRFPQGPCVRSTAPPAGDFAPISGHEERQLRLALAAQDVEVDVDPGPRRAARPTPASRTRQRCTGTRAVRRTTFFEQRVVDAGRIASSERPLGGRGLCQPAKMNVVVRRCRAFAVGTRPAGPRFAERC